MLNILNLLIIYKIMIIYNWIYLLQILLLFLILYIFFLLKYFTCIYGFQLTQNYLILFENYAFLIVILFYQFLMVDDILICQFLNFFYLNLEILGQNNYFYALKKKLIFYFELDIKNLIFYVSKHIIKIHLISVYQENSQIILSEDLN